MLFNQDLPTVGKGFTVESRARAQTLFIPVVINVVEVAGYANPNDGGGGIYARVGSQPAHAGKFQDLSGSWFEIQDDIIDVRSVGAVGDGVTNDYNAIVNAYGIGRRVSFSNGTYRIGTSYTITNPIMLGGILRPSSGITVTISGNLDAPLKQIFDTSAGGVCAMDLTSYILSYPEYWGAVANDGSAGAKTANTVAIQACLDNSRVVMFQADDYYYSNTIKIRKGYIQVFGGGCQYNGLTRGGCTRLLVDSASATALQIGPDVQPGTLNEYLQGIIVRDLYCSRLIAPDNATEATGIDHRWTLRALIENVNSAESIFCWRIRGVVYARHNNVIGFRSILGSGVGAERSWVFYVDANADIAAGGNASLYFDGVSAGNQGAADGITNSACMYIQGKFTDTFINDLETIGGQIGLRIDASGTQIDDNVDFVVNDIICDQHYFAGIYISGVNSFGNLEFNSPYAGMKAGATAAFFVQSNSGTININGGRLLCAGNYPGISATGGTININSTIIWASTNNAVIVSNVINSNIAPVVQNFTGYTAQRCVYLFGGCTGNIVAPTATGVAGFISEGVRTLNATDTRNQINWTKIPSAWVTANRFVEAGTNITVVGNTANLNNVTGI